MTKTRVGLIAILTLLVAWLWKLGSEGTDRVEAQPASTSVSFENYLEERDEEQRRWDEGEGLT